jgi:hypothetical protein
MVGLAADRVVYCRANARRVKAICTSFVARAAVIGVWIGSIVVAVHLMWVYELVDNDNCTVDPGRQDFEAVVWPWITAVLLDGLPLAVTFVLAVPLAADSCRWRMSLTSSSSGGPCYRRQASLAAAAQLAISGDDHVHSVSYERGSEKVVL